jgi:hypothetical protein
VKPLDPDELKKLLRLRVQALGEEALQCGGSVPANDADELVRLGKLVEAAERVSPKRRSLWPPAVLFLFTLLVVSLLGFGRIGRTEIVLDVQVDEVGFQIPAREILLQSISLSHLGISGDTTVDLPDASGGFRRIERAPVSLAVLPAGTLDLSSMPAEAGTHVSIQYAGTTGRFRISEREAESAHRVSVSGPVEITGGEAATQRVAFRVPRPVRVHSGKQGANFDVTITVKDAVRIISNLRVSALEMIHLDQVADPEGTAIRRRSTLRGGTLYFESLNGRSQPLRAGQLLRLEGVDGELRVVDLKPDSIGLQYHGWANGLISGSAENSAMLIPTWLEWLKERKGLYLIWGTALYLFGVVAGFLRWLRLEI